MKPLLSIVTPAFNEASNLPELYRRFVASLEGVDWEWIAVDDHSGDETFAVLSELAKSDPRVRGIRLAKNSGPHAAVLCGLTQVRGDAATFLAADLQDPPEILPKLLVCWREGAKLVWATCFEPPPDKTFIARFFSRLYHIGVKLAGDPDSLPPEGAGIVLIDRTVIDALEPAARRDTNIFLLLAQMGLPQACVTYEKQARHSGRSGWTLKKKIKLGLDSFRMLSRPPLLAMPSTDGPRCHPPYLVEKTTGNISA